MGIKTLSGDGGLRNEGKAHAASCASCTQAGLPHDINTPFTRGTQAGHCKFGTGTQGVQQRFSQPPRPDKLDKLLERLIASVCACVQCVLRNLNLRLPRPAFGRDCRFLCFWPSWRPAGCRKVDACVLGRSWTWQARVAADKTSQVPPFERQILRTRAPFRKRAAKNRFRDPWILQCSWQG